MANYMIVLYSDSSRNYCDRLVNGESAMTREVSADRNEAYIHEVSLEVELVRRRIQSERGQTMSNPTPIEDIVFNMTREIDGMKPLSKEKFDNVISALKSE